jgi:hypothetical protein
MHGNAATLLMVAARPFRHQRGRDYHSTHGRGTLCSVHTDAEAPAELPGPAADVVRVATEVLTEENQCASASASRWHECIVSSAASTIIG